MVYSPFLLDKHCVELTFFQTGTAFDTGSLINEMDAFTFAGYGVDWTVAGTSGTTNAVFGFNYVL
jgi:hypothetical protein